MAPDSSQDDWIGLIPVGQEAGLVLGDEPASTAFLPEHGLFVRWCAAESEADMLQSINAAIEVAVWAPCDRTRWFAMGHRCLRSGPLRSSA